MNATNIIIFFLVKWKRVSTGLLLISQSFKCDRVPLILVVPLSLGSYFPSYLNVRRFCFYDHSSLGGMRSSPAILKIIKLSG